MVVILTWSDMFLEAMALALATLVSHVLSDFDPGFSEAHLDHHHLHHPGLCLRLRRHLHHPRPCPDLR